MAIGEAWSHSWYPANCCSGQDCEPIPVDAVEEVAEGWHIRFVSPRFGLIDETVRRAEARHSEDGGFHGCWRKDETAPRTICFFAPVNT